MFRFIKRFVNCVMGTCQNELTATQGTIQGLARGHQKKSKKIEKLQANYEYLYKAWEDQKMEIARADKSLDQIRKDNRKLFIEVENLNNELKNQDLDNRSKFKEMLNAADDAANAKPENKGDEIEEEINKIDDTIKQLGDLLPKP